ncbi:MAG: YabP/YqfC family sporulation protein [Clostridia bacterium]|nr:YabP/YqfC family sporulation protein [Clostridia bacterium]
MLIEEFLTDGLEKKNGFKYTNYNNEVLVIENIKNLIYCYKEEIVIKLKQGEIKIEGKNLKIKELGKTTICISGEIDSITSN